MIEKRKVGVPCVEQFEYQQEFILEDGRLLLRSAGLGMTTFVLSRPGKKDLIGTITDGSTEVLVEQYRETVERFIAGVTEMQREAA